GLCRPHQLFGLSHVLPRTLAEAPGRRGHRLRHVHRPGDPPGALRLRDLPPEADRLGGRGEAAGRSSVRGARRGLGRCLSRGAGEESVRGGRAA
ncbi:unnamed protein product, partial [Ectocarpus fasciculatus]